MMRQLIFGSMILLATACSVSSEPVVTEPVPTVPIGASVGTLTVEWTIDLTTDPNRCNASVASSISIEVLTTSGLSAGVFEQACEAFATSITLGEGSYTATAVLLDPAGQQRTTAVPINPFTIVGNQELRIPIDFPSSSFF